MPADNELDPLDSWLSQQVRPLPPPSGTFELITKRARRRRIRQAVVSVASAAVVAAAVGVAVPVGMSLHLSATSASNSVAAGLSHRSGRETQSALGTATKEPGPSAPSGTASASGSTTPGLTTPGYLPPDFRPYSVTWDSLSTGWIMGPAGTPGHCGARQDSSICTSIARTGDGGLTWHGLPAPPVGGPMSATGVTGLRFLNASYGWAFGPELWATDDGGEHWHSVDTGGLAVTDLETANGRAYALFGECTPPAGTTRDTIANCTHFTLKSAPAGSDTWAPVGGVPVNLALGTGGRGSAVIELDGASSVIELGGATSKEPATGYLVAPDGTLYAGPLDGSAWHEVVKLPCAPGVTANDGLPQDLLLAPAGTTSSGVTRLAIFCTQTATAAAAVYRSADNGSTWTRQTSIGSSGTASIGAPQSLTALPNGTLILATETNASAPGGIYLLTLGASKWQAVTLSDPSASRYGFTYVGMTGPLQGVALSASPELNEIWMTIDGGQTWQARPIQS
jgi:hypothetical protein